MKVNISPKLTSRKFIMSVVTGILVITNKGLGLDLPEESIKQVVLLIASYILGESWIDAKKEGNYKEKQNKNSDGNS